MCFYADEMSCLPDLPTEVWLKFFRRLDSLAVHNICLSGGEVFVRKDIFEILEFLANTRMRYSILSNGTLISEDVVSKLLKPNIRRKLKHIQISVDGSCPEVHDKIRSDGSFVKTDRALRLIKSAGINLGVRVTINKHNLLDLEDIFAYLFNEIGLAVVSTNSVVEIGEAKDGGNEVGLNPSERLSAMEKLHTLSTNAWPGRIQASAGPLYELKQFAAMEKGEPLSAKYNGHLSACGCYFNKLAVNHDGSVTPCNMLGKMELGNLQTTDISEIWNGSSLKELRHRSAKKLTEVEKCAECQFQTIRNGGCPGTAYEKYGTVFMPNPDNCYRNFRDALNPDELNRLLELFEKK
jgi:SynChlorMet cassette radical SAM/SPASM protein ScmE